MLNCKGDAAVFVKRSLTSSSLELETSLFLFHWFICDHFLFSGTGLSIQASSSSELFLSDVDKRMFSEELHVSSRGLGFVARGN